MDTVVAETGLSISAVYRYFHSKEELIHATAEEGVGRLRAIFVALLERDPCPNPAETLDLVSADLRNRTGDFDYDVTRLALQGWAEALRDEPLHQRIQARYRDTLDCIAELADRWCNEGYLPPDADTKAVAAAFFSVMQGRRVMHHLVDDVPADALRAGVALLGIAVATPSDQPHVRANP